MKFMFVHQNFPGQYLHILRDLLAENERHPGAHEIVFMTEPNENHLHGVRKVTYARPPVPNAGIHRDAHDFNMAMRRAEAAAAGARQIKSLGFTPDIIIGHHGWGELLNLGDVYPDTPLLGYFEFYYRIENSDVNFDPEFPLPPERFGSVRAKNCVNLQAYALGQHGQVPTRWQHSTYPDWAHTRLHIIEEGVDLALCKPPSAPRKTLQIGTLRVTPKQKLITYVARNLEPYRGFHSFMRALPAIQKANPGVVVSIVGGDDISYGAPHPNGPWRQVMLAELAGKLDLSRIHFLGKIPYDQHLQLLQRSDAHVYLSYPFVASWSLREAMACGCVVVGGDTETVTEFITHDQTGLITETLNPATIASTVTLALSDPKRAARLRKNARAYAERHLAMDDYLRRYRALIERIAGQPLRPQPRSKPRPQPATRARKPAAR